jgi:hypothetical protein
VQIISDTAEDDALARRLQAVIDADDAQQLLSEEYLQRNR